VEALRAAYEGETVLGALTREEMVEAPTLMGVVGANVSSCVGDGRANEVEPQSVGMPDRATLTPESLRKPGFSPSWEATLDDIPSIPGSFDIVDLVNRLLGLSGYPERHFYQPAHRGHGVDMLAGHDRGSTSEGDIVHGWLGCFATNPGQSKDGKRMFFLCLIFPHPSPMGDCVW
jgi:hypothetical protein